jgi:hypothetical protein
LINVKHLRNSEDLQSIVLHLLYAVGGSNRLKAHQEVMLPLVVALHFVRVRKAIEACVRHTLIVVAPGDALVFEEINDSGHVLVDDQEAVAIGTEGVSTSSGNVGRLTWGTDAVKVGEQDALVDQSLAVGWGIMLAFHGL